MKNKDGDKDQARRYRSAESTTQAVELEETVLLAPAAAADRSRALTLTGISSSPWSDAQTPSKQSVKRRARTKRPAGPADAQPAKRHLVSSDSTAPKGPISIEGAMSKGLHVAMLLESKRTKPGTKQNYKSKIAIMIRLMAQYSPKGLSSDDTITIPADSDSVLAFFGHLCSDASSWDCGTNETQTAQAPLSESCVKGNRSALVDIYKRMHLKIESDLNCELKGVLDGYDKLVNDLKKKGKMKIIEGKRQLKSDGFRMIASKLMKWTPKEAGFGKSWSMFTFAWSFFVSMWNLMSRADSVDSLMLQHIEWAEDALVIEEQGHKGDQTGENKYGKRIYANPIEPGICPILSIAVLIFCYPGRARNGKQQLFWNE